MDRFCDYKRRIEVGKQRQALLETWVREDLHERNDPTLRTALKLWRNDVVSRLGRDRPLVARIPRIFVQHLKLPGQLVMFTESNEVTQVISNLGNEMKLGDVIVAQS